MALDKERRTFDEHRDFRLRDVMLKSIVWTSNLFKKAKCIKLELDGVEFFFLVMAAWYLGSFLKRIKSDLDGSSTTIEALLEWLSL